MKMNFSNPDQTALQLTFFSIWYLNNSSWEALIVNARQIPRLTMQELH